MTTEIDEGARLRDAALVAVEHGAGEWIDFAMVHLFQLAEEQDEFTTDDMWSRLDGNVPDEPRALGAVMMKGRKMKICEVTPRYVCSRRACNHKRGIRVWRSLRRA
jgi:hypothetical protein